MPRVTNKALLECCGGDTVKFIMGKARYAYSGIDGAIVSQIRDKARHTPNAALKLAEKHSKMWNKNGGEWIKR